MSCVFTAAVGLSPSESHDEKGFLSHGDRSGIKSDLALHRGLGLGAYRHVHTPNALRQHSSSNECHVLRALHIDAAGDDYTGAGLRAERDHL